MVFGDTLRNRGFQIAIACSLTWHAFWLFAVSANFNPSSEVRRPTQIYFLGPVLTDDAFNMLVSTKPELSATHYLAEESVSQELDPPLESMGRQEPADLVSVPSGDLTWNILRGVLHTDAARSSPLFAEKFQVDIAQSPYPITGALAKRGLIHFPELPAELARARGKGGPALTDAVFELTVSAKGDVTRADALSSTGDPSRDAAWQDYLKKWQFFPSPEFSTADEKGQVRIRAGSEGDAP